MKKWIFCDMDGTLLDEAGNLPPMFDEVMAALKARGAVFCPASGRQYSALTQQMQKYVDDFVFISENGTFAARHDEELFSDTMERADAERVLTAGRAIDRSYPVLCGKRCAYVEPEWKPYLGEMQKYFTKCEVVDDLMQVVKTEEIIKVAFCDVKHGASEERLYPYLRTMEEVAPVQVLLASNYWVDVLRVGTGKGVAVRRLQAMYGISPEDCVAFGDYLNDVDLFNAVGHSYAMANAHPDAKKAARYEAPSNAAYGVMQVLRNMLEQGEI